MPSLKDFQFPPLKQGNPFDLATLRDIYHQPPNLILDPNEPPDPPRAPPLAILEQSGLSRRENELNDEARASLTDEAILRAFRNSPWPVSPFDDSF